MNSCHFPNDADIIIIGAGISGMSSAFYLLEREPTLTILVLEAKQRIGGRTLTMPLRIAEGNHFRSFDLGGHFVSSSQIHLTELIRKLGLNLIKDDKCGKAIWNLDPDKIILISGNPFNLETMTERLELFKFFEKFYQLEDCVTFNNAHSLPDSNELDMETMESFITENLNSTLAQNFVRHLVRISCGIEPTEITVLYFLAFCNAAGGIENLFSSKEGGAKAAWIEGGADTICQRIAGKIGRDNIKQGDPVIRILRNNNQVMIETEATTYICRYVIIAILPSEILDITFTPPLPSTRTNILRTLVSGHLIKFVVTYEKAFWKEKGYSGDIVSYGKEGGHGPINSCCDISNKNCAALTGCITSIDCLEQPPESYRKDVLCQLARYFGDEALEPLDYIEKSWLEEPHTFNCVMHCAGFGSMNNFHEIRRPIGRLFWAGTETATQWNGYMGGAAQAGYRAAIELLYEFRPQLLTIRDILYVNARKPHKRSLTQKIISYGTSWKMILPIIALVGTIIYIRRRHAS